MNSIQFFLPLLAFAFATSITPGPNNSLVMLTAANWGFRASLPVFFGVVVGFLVLLFAVGIGLGGLFAAWPAGHVLLKWICFAWLVVMAWNIARAGYPTPDGVPKTKPLTFLQIAVFQWVNPKAWMMAIGAMALFVPVGSESLSPVLRVMAAFVLAGAPCVLAWAAFGVWMARFLTSPRRVTVFNVVMAALLVVSMIPTLF